MNLFYRFVFFFSLLLGCCLIFAARSEAQCGPILTNTPYAFSVNQQANERVSITVTTNSSALYGTYYYIEFLNSEGQVVGGGDAAPYGCGQVVTFGPYCPVAQGKRNIASARIVSTIWSCEVVDVSIGRVYDTDPINVAGATSATESKAISQSTTVTGSLTDVPDDDPERYQYYRVGLDKNQKLLVSGWARSATTQYGATLFGDIIREGNTSGAGVFGVAPYGTAQFTGGFVNQGEAGTFLVRVWCDTWTICKYKMNLSVAGGSIMPPPGDCGPKDDPCSEEKLLYGPAKTFPVQLSTGYEESEFKPDLEVYNPVGDSVTFQRSWQEALSLGLRASPGFSPGWTHSYDVYLNTVEGGNLNLVYPNGGTEELVRVASQGNPTEELRGPAGSGYFVRGTIKQNTTATDTHYWDWVEVVWKDGTIWRFVPKDEFLYRLVKITNSTGQSLHLKYDGPDESDTFLHQIFTGFFEAAKDSLYRDTPEAALFLHLMMDIFHSNHPSAGFRLSSIRNDANTTLLSLQYRDTDGRLIGVSDAYGRKVDFSHTQPAAFDYPVLNGVSLVKSSTATSSTTLDNYTYAAYGRSALLTHVKRRHPNGGSTQVTAQNYYDTQARVTKTTDANGNSRNYFYESGATRIEVRNSANQLQGAWRHYFDSLGRDTG